MEQTAVVTNGFGEIGLDHLLVESAKEDMVLLDSGCLCCSVRGDLVDTLRRLAGRARRGAQAGRRRRPAADHQGRLAAPETIAALEARLRQLNPAAPILAIRDGQVAPGALFNAGLYDPETKTLEVRRWLQAEAYGHDHGHSHDVNRHDEHIRAFCLTIDEPLDWDRATARWRCGKAVKTKWFGTNRSSNSEGSRHNPLKWRDLRARRIGQVARVYTPYYFLRKRPHAKGVFGDSAGFSRNFPEGRFTP